MSGRSLLVLGGARSGKSRYAQARVEQMGNAPAFIATAQAYDAEMANRIARHRADRDSRWTTFETPLDLPEAIADAARKADAVLVDCLTLWLSNLLLAEKDVDAAGAALERAILACPRPVALVANEVGFGIVPDNALARRFRDEAGWLNQRLARISDEVVLVAAGLPMILKPPPSP
ncbi:bifunctional adenosylcobinamide kinase/adenosylcobinamide-phosphate guanylyltransferase [Sphingobium cloacae]|uniref:Bifunctional adenosylcobalamin biosynthesis protein n=1 Tax=Sphingobium cloacae TaxID=120107 RepID=A0A1E1F2D7_9SPHN|nr:bifunctional adenosylcobinamide kinase/adenosylcobinamide-phosphate guanylyltransferase [Sphingobium cloacae]BAV64622.1 cobalamin biosynthesis enzyme [Sphingobium cloacae]